MDNLFFDNNVSVSVTQNPSLPSEGDDVTFVATAKIDNVTIDSYEYNNPTYFFSYTWLVSENNGVSYKQIGSDTETLTIRQISKEAINYIYKVKVAVIDLNNMLLTEDGDNLTTQYGELLLNNTVSSGINSQTIVSNIPKINVSQDTASKDIINVQSIIDEHKTYDPLIDDTAAAKIYSLYPSTDEIVAGKKIQGDPDVIVPVESIPDPDIEIPSEPQNVRIQAGCSEESTSVCGATITWCKNLPPCNSGEKCVSGDNQATGVSPNYKKGREKFCCGSINRICAYEKALCSNGSYAGSSKCLNSGFVKPRAEPDINWETELNNDCGCKDATKTVTPLTIEERDGLYRISYIGIGGSLIAIISGLLGIELLPVIAVAAGIFVVIGGATGTYLWRRNEALGNEDKMSTANCTDKYTKDVWECIDCAAVTTITGPEGPSLENFEQLPTPTYSCSCRDKNGNSAGGSVTIGRSQCGCHNLISQKCGPVGGSCDCTSSDGTSGTIRFSIPDDKPDDNMVNINSEEFFDCIFVDPIFCAARCEGPLCCGNNSKTVTYRIESSEDSAKCNTSKTLKVAGVPENTIKIEPCNPDSTNDLSIVVVKIIPEMTEDGSGLTLEEAKEQAISTIGNKYGIIVTFKMVKSTVKEQLCTISSSKVLYKYYKSEYSGYEVLPNCKKCKPIYTVSCGDGSYPCDDSSLPCPNMPSQNCKGSEGSTSIIVATISKNDNPSDEDIDNADKGGDTYTTLGGAKSKALLCIGDKPGVICSG